MSPCWIVYPYRPDGSILMLMTSIGQNKPTRSAGSSDLQKANLNPPKIVGEDAFASAVINWYWSSGRQNLPWQDSDDPYRRWVSEIMLQQTQVTTVIPYFLRFIKQFPDISTLANSDIDQVFSYWTGLGYYTRARNLHRTARIVEGQHQGKFPDTYEEIVSFPGIGRSTAGAILAFSFGKPYPILDGNVRRVLARYHAIGGWPGKTKVADRLWSIAETHTPVENVGDYTQGMMDLGAKVCLRRQPHCLKCPLSTNCKGFEQENFAKFPGSRPKQKRSKRIIIMIMVRDHFGRVLLHQRPAFGIWAGLWSFPECPDGASPEAWIHENFGLRVKCGESWEVIHHGLSHLKLEIRPLPAKLCGTALIMKSCVWYKPGTPAGRGLAAPVRRLLQQL